jgi:hypothetical protein
MTCTLPSRQRSIKRASAGLPVPGVRNPCAGSGDRVHARSVSFARVSGWGTAFGDVEIFTDDEGMRSLTRMHADPDVSDPPNAPAHPTHQPPLAPRKWVEDLDQGSEGRSVGRSGQIVVQRRPSRAADPCFLGVELRARVIGVGAQLGRTGSGTCEDAGGAFSGRSVPNVPIASAAEALPTLDVAEAANVSRAVERIPAIRRWMSREHRTPCRRRKPSRFRR